MQRFSRYFFLVFCFVASIRSVRADEGMWLPQLLQTLNEADMKKQGMKINAEDIYSISRSSLKDAIVSLGGFCTAEVISSKGLLLTNHHCGFDYVQNHSSLQNNYIRDGFWARNLSQELPNPGLTVTFIIRIDDVTVNVLNNTAGVASQSQRQSIIDKNISDLRKTIAKESYQDVVIRPFFEGNKYYAFVTEVYRDVRLVGAPPSSIGNFGKDTDNWMWPRHTGDFSLFRIYAGKDNKPAAYSPDNVPYVPKRSLNISLDGVDENDFTMVFGFPGRTYEYLPSPAVAQIMNVNDPAKINIRKQVLGILNEFMRSDEQIKIQYADKYARVENAYKKWQGEVLGLKTRDVVELKQNYEAEFQKRVNANAEWKNKYGDLLPQLGSAYALLEPYGLARDYYAEVTSRLEILNIAGRLNRIVSAFEKNGKPGYDTALQTALPVLKEMYRDFNAAVDETLFAALLKMFVNDQKEQNISPALLKLLKMEGNSFTGFASHTFKASHVDDSTTVFNWLSNDPAEAVKQIEQDFAVQLLVSFQSAYTKNISEKLSEIQSRINLLQRTYMAAQMEVFKEKKFYPDANSTLRVTYGKAKGYSPKDGVHYSMYTHMDGVMEKYIPGDYEFDVPAKLIELYNKKDFGRYGTNGRQTVCFIATNHTTGGNSGSPALDAYGNLIGLNFDRVWEGTMSDLHYDSEICRNIMVDIRYVAFIIDKFAGAQNLIDEMKFVHPKAQKK